MDGALLVTPEQGERDLEVLLSYLLNRQLRQGEIIEALGISRSAFYEQRGQGQLTNPKNLIAVATYFGLSSAELLLRYGHLDADDVLRLSEKLKGNPTLLTRTEVSLTTDERFNPEPL